MDTMLFFEGKKEILEEKGMRKEECIEQ